MTSDAEWERIAAELVDLAEEDRLDEFLARVAGLLARGRVWQLTDHLGDLRSRRPGATDPIGVRLLLAELMSRDQTIGLPDLLDLERDVRAADGPEDLLWWITAILAEWGLWRGDFATFGYAFAAQPPEAGSRLVLLCGARLKRVQALVALATDPGGSATIRVMEQVDEMFARAEAPEEQAMTQVLSGLAKLSVDDDLDPGIVTAIRAGVAELDRLDADRLPAGLALVAWSTYLTGDFLACADALDRFAEVDTSPMPPLVIEGVAAVHEMSRMYVEGPSPEIIASLRAIFERLRRSTVPAWMLTPLADDLLDQGQIDFAEELVLVAGSVPSIVRAASQANREVQARIRILRHRDRSAVADLWDLYTEWDRDGRARRAAASAARCSWTCRTAGLVDDAAELAAWADARLPAPESRTVWEQAYLGGSVGVGAADTALRGSLRVLSPDVIVERGGEDIRLGDVQARLLALLAAARRPVTTDWIVTALWSDADLEAGRNRLAAVIHRIRQRLDLLPDELLRRTRHGLELDGHGWDIDVWRFWDLTDGDDEDREQAIDLYRSDLAARQLAYDDMLQDQRDLLRRRWIDTVRALVDSGRISASEARARAHRLGGSAEDELAEI